MTKNGSLCHVNAAMEFEAQGRILPLGSGLLTALSLLLALQAGCPCDSRVAQECASDADTLQQTGCPCETRQGLGTQGLLLRRCTAIAATSPIERIVMDRPYTCTTSDAPNAIGTQKWNKARISFQIDGGSVSADIAQMARVQYAEAAALCSSLIPMDIVESTAGELADISVTLCLANETRGSCGRLVYCEDGLQLLGESTLPNDGAQVTQTLLAPANDDAAQRNIFYGAALHELLHALGLLHSENPHDLMFGVQDRAQLAASRAALSDRDVAVLRSKYGSRNGTIDPDTPLLPTIPRPGQFVQPVADGPDADGDGLSDDVELLETLTDGTSQDTDRDGLSDAFEVTHLLNPRRVDSDADGRADMDEVLAGSEPRAPLICNARSLELDSMVAFVDSRLLADFGVSDGDSVTLENALTGCLANGVIVKAGPESACGISIQRDLRERLCIYQTSVMVPLRLCREQTPATLFDFETAISQPVLTTGSSANPRERGGDRVLEFRWTLDGPVDDAFCILDFAPRSTSPCGLLRMEIESSTPVNIRLEAKSPGNTTAQEIVGLNLAPDVVTTVELPITRRYAFGLVAIVIERDMNTGPVRSGVLWIDDIKIVR